MRWEKIALREVVDFRNGINFDKSAYSSGVKLIGVSNFGERFSPDYEELQEVDPKVVRSDDFLIDGDIVFVRSNGNKELVGRCMLITEPEYSVTYSGFCIRARIRDTNQYDPTFFTYYFKSSAFRKALSGNAVGTNIQNLSQDRLSSHIAYVPTIEMQRKIASVLSAYDDLIENNQKQIKLLEEAAQRLYKEWFVDLRFPGHETTPIVDGVPEGWKQDTINSIIELQSGFAFKSADFCDSGTYKIVTIKNVQDGLFDGKNVSKINDIPARMPPHCRLNDGDILLSLTGNVGRVCVVNGQDYLLNQRVAKIKSDYPVYAYCLFRSSDMFTSMGNLANGAAQQNLSPIKTGQIKTLIPSVSLLIRFEVTASAYLKQMLNLNKQIELFQQARDRLLPKLMNGEIEV